MFDFLKGKNKYGNRKTSGHASRKESRRAAQLKVMEMAGVISELREQVAFELIPAQFAADPTGKGKRGKCIERAVKYIADFVYKDSDGHTIVEDSKGFRTKEYVIKRKLMLYVHGIKITET